MEAGNSAISQWTVHRQVKATCRSSPTAWAEDNRGCSEECKIVCHFANAEENLPPLHAPKEAVLAQLCGSERWLAKEPKQATTYSQEIQNLLDASYVTPIHGTSCTSRCNTMGKTDQCLVSWSSPAWTTTTPSWLDSQPLRLNSCSISRTPCSQSCQILPFDPPPSWPPLASCEHHHNKFLVCVKSYLAIKLFLILILILLQLS